ncbi:MAG TPA: alpha/beta hydrolase [Acidimicrobiia bacterium]|nr:alpha/beta hydrolase [Acidimicrobiia bacterium]
MAAAVQSPLWPASVSGLPHGRHIELARRGTTFVREVAGPPGAPTILLLHGWVASGALNWFQAFEPLAEHFTVIAPDLRGHARGLRSRRIFRLADCADDCAATLVEMGSGPVIAVGYSMGGPVAQLLWRRHRDLVAGMVLCATSAGFMPHRLVRRTYQTTMLAVTTFARAAAMTTSFVPAFPFVSLGDGNLPAWAADEVRRHDWRMIIEAGHSISTYYAPWIRDVDVPSSIVCTTDDHGVPPSLQLAAADAIRNATVHRVADGHLACAGPRFAQPLVTACRDVAARVR